MEGLNNIIKIATLNGWIHGFEVATTDRGIMEVTHLLYADDILIFCDAKEDPLRYLRVILLLFGGVSGLHINWRKNLLFPINEVTQTTQPNAILGGEVCTLPTTYLGLLWGANSKSKGIRDVLLKTVRRNWPNERLSTYLLVVGWHSFTLS